MSMQKILNCYPFLSKVLQKAYYGLFSGPKNLVIHLGNGCNYNCIYCYSEGKANGKELTANDWTKIIDVAAEMGIKNIGFSGGEPFLNPDFCFLLSYAAEKVPFINIITNGSLINEEWIQKIKKLDVNIQMMIKFDSPLTYGKHTRRPGMFEKIEDTIKRFSKQEITVIAIIVLTKYNIRLLAEIMKSAVEMGAYPLIERFIPIKDAQTNRDIEIDEKDWEKALRLCMKLYSGYTYFNRSLIPLKGSLCGCFTNSMSITSDGFVLPCPIFPIEQNLGNVKDKSLKDIWKEYKKKRKNWLKIPGECDTCEKKYLCGGGCKTHTYLKYETTDNKDPLCTGIPPTYCHVAFLAASLKKGLR